ncbi:hypothetical protein L7F22_007087 [Adiantum nelumboides]|nr:hypothetical protein [Adiantum nelumboides]
MDEVMVQHRRKRTQESTTLVSNFSVLFSTLKNGYFTFLQISNLRGPLSFTIDWMPPQQPRLRWRKEKEEEKLSRSILSLYELLNKDQINDDKSLLKGRVDPQSIFSFPFLPSKPQQPQPQNPYLSLSRSRHQVIQHKMGRFTEYMVIGRHLPTEREPTPKLYRMRIFAPNETVAKSRFWYFVRQLRKMKRATGEIVAIHAIHEAKPLKVKNFGIWLRYNSRSGTHNMYKEYRDLSRAEAVEAMYQDMAARHRARFGSIHEVRIVDLLLLQVREFLPELIHLKLRLINSNPINNNNNNKQQLQQHQQQQLHNVQPSFQSSADIYASSSQYQENPRPNSSFSMNRSGSRPGTSMSSSMHSADGGSTASNNTRDLRRGSVMSFQTALSGTGTGFMSGSDADDGGNGRFGGNSPINPREDIWNDGFDPVNQNGNTRLQPWLNGAQGPGSGSNHSGIGYGTSPDERIPGGWGGRVNTPPPPPHQNLSSSPQIPSKQQFQQQQQQQQPNQVFNHAHSNSQSRLLPSPQLRSKELPPRTSSPQLNSSTANRMSVVGLGLGHKASPSNTSSLHSRKASETSKSDLKVQTQSTTPNASPSPSSTRFFSSSTAPSPSSEAKLKSPALNQVEVPTPTTAKPQPPKEVEENEEDEDEEAALQRHTTIRASGQSSHSRTPSQPMPNAFPDLPSKTSSIPVENPTRSAAPSPGPLPPPKESQSPKLEKNQIQPPSQHSPTQSRTPDSQAPTPPAKVPSPQAAINAVLPPSIVAASDIIPPPLPASVVEAQRSHKRDLSADGKFEPVPVIPPADHSPVSDFRQKPLATITAQSQADGTSQLEKMQSQMREEAGPPVGMGIRIDQGRGGAIVGGARDTSLTIASMPQGDGPKNPMAPRRGSSGNLLLPKAVLAEAPQPNANSSMMDLLPNDDNPNNSAMSESESISREPSPPPEGEIEARAQWVQAQMKLQQKRDKDKDKLRAQEKKERELYNKEQSKSRSNSIGNNLGTSNGTLRSQLKPLQLSASGSPNFAPTMVRNASNLSYSATPNDPNNLKSNPSSGGALSTQQLQKQSARDQRRSVGTLSMAMSGNDMAAGGSSGPYPAFSSPTTGPTRPTGPNGARLYPGVLPQRSLVAPFELQQRPDGLLSGLIGPDGVRRSVNDPEVCLECMMRDEDMIDVQVIGQGLWERESDREFIEAVRNEEEEDRRRLEARNGGGGDTSSLISHKSESQTGSGSVAHEPSSAKPNGRGRLHKRIGKSDPLTAERLKLHTQMVSIRKERKVRNVRLRRSTLIRTFLAVQAKFIAMEQRARAETDAERKAADIRLAAARERERAHVLNAVEYDNRLVRARAAAQQDASALLRVAKGDERAAKEKDIASAREARRALAASEGANVSVAGQPQPPSGQGRPPTLTALNTSNPNNLSDEEKRRFSSPLLANSAHSIPRRSGLSPAPIRAGSSQDLRSLPGAMAARGGETPASIDSNGFGLAPPSIPFGSNGTPRGFGKYGGSATSQISLAPSGSMVDMHVGLGEKDRNEHRLSQAGFVLPGAKGTQSPSALNRAYYGFPEMDAAAAAGEGNDLDGIAQANANAASAAAARQSAASPVPPAKNRSARGFDDELGPHAHEESLMIWILTTDSSSRKSVSSGSPRNRGASLGPDNSMDLAPPPGLSGLLQRARRSTSSLIAPSFDAERERTRSGSSNLQIYNHPPGMASSNSLDPGPFQPPVPPPRAQSKDLPSNPSRGSESKKELRASSSSSFMGPQSSRGQPHSPINATHPASPSGSRTNSVMSFQSRGVPPPRAGSHRTGLNGATDYSADGGAFTKHSRGPSGPYQQQESHMRVTSGGGDGRGSVSGSRSNQTGKNSPSPSSVLQFSDGVQSRPSTQGGNPMTPPLSQDQQGPRRPPRSPHREGTTPSVTSSGAGHEQRQVFGQQQRSFGLQQQFDNSKQQQQQQFHQLLPVDATPPAELDGTIKEETSMPAV